MIEARGLVKRYGSTTAVDNLSFDVRPGTVTGFLGPNGAGFVLLCLYTAVALAAGCWAPARRDA
jgi:ABC-type Na+ transport system ATPase subunit NatA